MSNKTYETTEAFHDLFESILKYDRTFLDLDERSVIEGYSNAIATFSAAIDAYIAADPHRPEMIDLLRRKPMRKYAGDTADAYYMFSIIDPSKTYRVCGTRGEARYSSITVYGSRFDDGSFPENTTTHINHHDIEFDEDGNFEIFFGPERPEGARNFVQFEADSNQIMTRDYHYFPDTDRRTTYNIEMLGEKMPAPRMTDAEFASRLRRAKKYVQSIFLLLPTAFTGEANTTTPPFKPPHNIGPLAVDAHYSNGYYELAEDEVLLIEGEAPQCDYWSMMLWNSFMQTFEYRYEPSYVNGGRASLNKEGRYKIAIAHQDPGIAGATWVATTGHTRGRIVFRFVNADGDVAQPDLKVVKTSELQA